MPPTPATPVPLPTMTETPASPTTTAAPVSEPTGTAIPTPVVTPAPAPTPVVVAPVVQAPKPQAPAVIAKPPAPIFTRSMANEKLNKHIDFYSKFLAKRGYNPHFKLNELQALGERLNNNDTAEAAIKAIEVMPSPTEKDVVVNQKVVDYDKANPPQPHRVPTTATSPTAPSAKVGGGNIKAPTRS